MATVFLPSGLRQFASGAESVEIDASRVHDLLVALSSRFPGMAESLARWQARLMPLNEDVAEVMPPSHVWDRLQAQLGWTRTGHRAGTVLGGVGHGRQVIR